MRIASYIVLCSLVFAAWGPRAARAVTSMSTNVDVMAPSVAEGPVSLDGPASTPPPPAEEPEPQPQPQAEVEIEQFVISTVDLEAHPPLAQASSPWWHEHLGEQSGVPRLHERPPRR